MRWEYEPGPTDPDDRLSQRLDLTQSIPEMQATPPTMPSQALQLMASKGYSHIYNGAWVFATPDNRNAWHSTPWNFLPRVGLNYRIGDDAVARVAYARYMMPISNVRDTLGDFVNQYTGFAQTTTTLGLAAGIPQQTLRDPFPANNPVIEPYGQAYGRYTGLGGAVSLDEYELRPQINDRFNLSFQKEIWGNTIVDLSYFYNWGSRVPYDVNVNMMDPAFRYEQRAALNTQVNNPFFGYLTVEKFPGALRNNRTVTLGSLLVPYPQYGAITQTNTNGKLLRTQTFEIRAQKPFASGISFLAAYAWNRERIQQWFDDIAQYQVLTTNGEEGWEWRPTDSPVHRFTMAFSWELPVGRDRAYFSDMSVPLDLVLGGLAIHHVRPLVLRPSAALRQQLRSHWRSASGGSDARALVRHERLPDSGYVCAEDERLVLRWPRRPVSILHRHDAHEELQPDAEVPARSAHRSLQRAEPHRVGQPRRRSGPGHVRHGDA